MVGSHGARRPLSVFLVCIAILALTSAVLLAVPRAAAQEFVTANGIILQQGQQMPVYKFATPQIKPSDTSTLSQRFSTIYSRQQVADENYRGLPRYSMVQTRTLSLLTQYGASGGFEALNVGEVARETSRGTADPALAQSLACSFLVAKGFMDGSGNLLLNAQQVQGARAPNPSSCDFDPNTTSLYKTSLIKVATVGAATPNQAPTATTVGVVVQVPLGIPQTATTFRPPDLPLGGPGGHLSLLFTTTDGQSNAPSLDSSVAGLAAVAMPFYGRSFSKLRDVPISDPVALRTQVEAQVKASYPGATNIQIPTPTTFYEVNEISEPQIALEPVLNFSGVQFTLDGQTVILRDITLPLLVSGPGGFGPAVSISTPSDGSTFNPSAPVALKGEISGGAAPFSYRWLLVDGTELKAATSLPTAGTVDLSVPSLPAVERDGTAQTVTVVLEVTDAEGAERTATVTLTPQNLPKLYLPLLRNQAGTQAAPVANEQHAFNSIEPAQAGYTYGIEANWDYPPAGAGGADLPGVIPDANGFANGMNSYGYSQRFYWKNSLAWEKDWRDCTLGGIDCTLGVDRADFVYYSGHGGAGGLSLASNKDSSWADGSKARFQSARWVGFSSCQTLRVQGYSAPNEPIRRWFNAFQGAHMLLGFNSNMTDIAFGAPLVDKMRVPKFLGLEFPSMQLTIAQAWTANAFMLNAGKPAYIYARSATVDPSANKLPRPSDPMPPRPLPVSSYHWFWWE